MTIKRTPRQIIDDHLNDAQMSITAAEKIADQHNLTFSWDLAYGMGGTYRPARPSYNRDELLAMIKEGTFNNLDYETKQAAIEVLSGTEASTDWQSSYSSSSGWNSSTSACS